MKLKSAACVSCLKGMQSKQAHTLNGTVKPSGLYMRVNVFFGEVPKSGCKIACFKHKQR